MSVSYRVRHYAAYPAGARWTLSDQGCQRRLSAPEAVNKNHDCTEQHAGDWARPPAECDHAPPEAIKPRRGE